MSEPAARNPSRRGSRSRAARSDKTPQRTTPATVTPPRIARDPWALAPILAAIALVTRAWFPRIGEPFADDFDFLTHAGAGGGWLDGGGSRFYWRPVARQLYYRTLGGAMLAHPAWIALLQGACLALAAWLLYRTLRRGGLSGLTAATAACVPLLMEPTRALVAWPTMFQDLGALLFAALAIHEASRSRMATSMVALAAALMCKEVAVVAALLLPLIPRRGAQSLDVRRDRLRWAAVATAVVIAWAALYAFVWKHAGLLFARDAVHDTHALATSWFSRLRWALGQSLTDAFDLAVLSDGARVATAWLLGAIAIATVLMLLVSAAARRRLSHHVAWVAWGAAWFLLATATLADVFPDWRPYRSPFGVAGLGIAIAAALGAVWPGLLVAFAVVRVAGFALAPAPPQAVVEKAGSRYSLDYAQVVRLQRLVGETRERLLERRPPPAPGLRAARHFYPPTALFAFAGDKSLAAWYRDTTARWLTVDRAVRVRTQPPPVVLEFQPPGRRQVTFVQPEALWHLERSSQFVTKDTADSALIEAELAKRLQTEPDSYVFTSLADGKRALALGALNLNDSAATAARQAIAEWIYNDDARYILILDHMRHGRSAEAAASLDTLIAANPNDPMLRRLRAQMRVARSPWIQPPPAAR
jgi:hypothetical protein